MNVQHKDIGQKDNGHKDSWQKDSEQKDIVLSLTIKQRDGGRIYPTEIMLSIFCLPTGKYANPYWQANNDACIDYARIVQVLWRWARPPLWSLATRLRRNWGNSWQARLHLTLTQPRVKPPKIDKTNVGGGHSPPFFYIS